MSGLYHIYSDYFKQIILNVFKYQLRHISWQQRFDLTRSEHFSVICIIWLHFFGHWQPFYRAKRRFVNIGSYEKLLFSNKFSLRKNSLCAMVLSNKKDPGDTKFSKGTLMVKWIVSTIKWLTKYLFRNYFEAYRRS